MEAKIDRNSNGLTHKGLFGFIFFITQFPSLITHHSSLITQIFTPVWHHHSISVTQYIFHTICGPYLSAGAAFSFLFFFSTQTHRS